MITHIRMKNFKSWKDSGEVKLAPLTGFFGTNSSGKSSLLQMLLLLKQTAGSDKILILNGENSLVNLGSFREMIHNHELETSLELEFACKPQSPFAIEILGVNSDDRRAVVPVLINNFSFNTAIRSYAENLIVERFRYSFESCDIREVRWEKGRLFYKNLLSEEEERRTSINNCYGGPASKVENVLASLSSAFEKLFSDIYYLGPTRAHPLRLYQWEGFHPESIGQLGDRMIDALLSARVRQLQTTENKNLVAIEQRISAWLQDMELAHSFSLIWSDSSRGRDYEVRIQKNPNSAEVTLADMGYGLAQFLPVLVLSYYVPEGSILILEQPGIHLHPKVQSQLADLFIEVVTERNIQILVESHSEHLLTRLQRRVAEKEIAQDDTALYFCRNNDKVSTIEPLEVTEFGEIKNWPENFFGDVMGDMFAMTDEQAKRMAEQDAED